MAIVRIKNLSDRLLIIRGNSGNSIHIMPNTVLDVNEVEVVNNSKVKKLLDSQLISRIPIEKLEKKKKR